MADFAQTIQNYLLVSGSDPTTKWGTMVWGVDNWGTNADMLVEIGKVIAESIANTSAIVKDIDKIIEVEDLTLTSEVIGDFSAFLTIAESLTLTSANDGLFLIDSEGFYHVFRGNTTEGEDKVISDYIEVTSNGTSWTPGSDPSTSWS